MEKYNQKERSEKDEMNE